MFSGTLVGIDAIVKDHGTSKSSGFFGHEISDYGKARKNGSSIKKEKFGVKGSRKESNVTSE